MKHWNRELPDRLKVLYPFERRYFEHPDGARQHYVDEGDGDTVVLMVHGNPSWSWLWRDLILRLRGSYRCVAVDHIGCGLSSRPGREYGYTLETHIANLRRLLDSLEFSKIHLVVHDWGGPIGLGALMGLGEKLDRVVITNTSAFPMRVGDWKIEICRKPWIGPLLSAGLGLFPKGAVRKAVVHPMAEGVAEGFLFPYRRASERRAIGAFVRDIPVGPRHPTWSTLKQVESFLPSLREREVLLLWGGRDFCFDARFLNEWRDRLPDARVEWYGDAGHYVLEDAGEVGIDDIAGFLGVPD